MIDSLHVQGFGVIAPHANLADFPLGPQIDLPKPDLGLLDRTLRRGLSDVTRMFMHVSQLALRDAEVSPSEVHMVFASAFGEISTAEALLQQAYEENSASPARFRHSVHNSSPGLLSIGVQNFLPATAIAAGWNTVAMALCEAHAQLSCGADRVLLVFADERVPEAISSEHAHGSLGAAFVLSRVRSAKHRGTLSHLRRASVASQTNPARDPFAGSNHPLGPALLLASALEERAVSTVIVGEGNPPWCVELDARVTP